MLASIIVKKKIKKMNIVNYNHAVRTISRCQISFLALVSFCHHILRFARSKNSMTI